MARVCTVCSHPERKAIDKGIVSAVPKRKLALEHGLTEVSVGRHASAHLRRATVKAAEAAEVKHGSALLAKLTDLQDRAIGLLNAAEERGSYVAATAAIGEARQCLQFAAKLTGELDERPTTNVLVTSPDWLALQSRILEALKPYPEAMEAVRSAVGEERAT